MTATRPASGRVRRAGIGILASAIAVRKVCLIVELWTFGEISLKGGREQASAIEPFPEQPSISWKRHSSTAALAERARHYGTCRNDCLPEGSRDCLMPFMQAMARTNSLAVWIRRIGIEIEAGGMRDEIFEPTPEKIRSMRIVLALGDESDAGTK